MILRRTVLGEIVSVGLILQQGGPGDCYLMDSVVLKAADGEIVQIRDVVVPGSIHWMLEIGQQGEFDVLYVQYPKPFGSYLRCCLAGVRSMRGNVNAAAEVRRWVSVSKGGALHFFWYGLVLMPAFGFGLLLWICAVRLLMMELPSLHVQRQGEV